MLKTRYIIEGESAVIKKKAVCKRKTSYNRTWVEGVFTGEK